MLREIQCINWSLLDPTPIAIEGPVVAVLGQNGSCKSSFMDAAKALLGARRFGQGRSATSYRYTGRAGAPAAKRAYVLGRFDNAGKRLKAVDSEQFTVILETTSSQRRFLVLEGDQLLRGDVAAGLAKLRDSYPRSRWLRPSEYTQRILEPLGIGPAMRRFLELPQGEIGRVMDRDNSKLVALLLELCGSRDAAERFANAEEALREAREAQRNVERRVERLRTKIAEEKLQAVERQQAEEQRLRLAQLLAQIDQLPEPEPEPEGKRRKATPTPRPLMLSASRRRELGLVLEDGVWRVPSGAEERVAKMLGPGEALPRAGAGLTGLVCGPAAKEGGDEAEAELQAPAPNAAQERQLRELKAIAARLREAGIKASGGEGLSFADVGELLGAARAVLSQGMPEAQEKLGEDDDALAELEQRLALEGTELERREQVLTEASAQLNRAREIYVEAARRALDGAAARFAELCSHAGMRGEMKVAATASGVECRISASEDQGGELRPLHGARNSLSGGWRATVIVLAVLACLSSEGATPLLLIDEVGSSLDEERLRKLGEAFATLGDQEGLLTMITVPSKTISQTVANFASQQIAFFRPEVTEPLAPPPHIISAAPKLRAA